MEAFVSRRMLVALLVSAFAAVPSAAAAPLPGAPGCPLFPRTNVWNKPVDRLPLAANSRAIVDAIGADLNVHADFGSGTWNGGPIGIPYTVVSGSQARVDVDFDYAGESDRGPYPIPANVQIEGGRGRTATARADRRPRELPPLRALRPLPPLRQPALVGRLRGNLEPSLEPPPPGRLDLGGRGGPLDPPRPRTLRRGRPRGDRPRSPLHGQPVPPRLRLPGTPPRLERDEREPPAHGPSPPAALELPSPPLSSTSPRRSPRPQALRNDRVGQRLELVHLGCPQPALVERPAAYAPPRQGLGLPRGRHAAPSQRLGNRQVERGATPGNRSGVDDRRRSQAEGREAIEDAFEVVQRAQAEPHEEAVLARDPVALHDFWDFTRRLRDPLKLPGRRPDPDDGRDRETDRLRVDLGPVPGDHPGPLEPLNALGDGRRRHADAACKIRGREPSVRLQLTEDSTARSVKDPRIVGIRIAEPHPFRHLGRNAVDWPFRHCSRARTMCAWRRRPARPRSRA